MSGPEHVQRVEGSDARSLDKDDGARQLVSKYATSPSNCYTLEELLAVRETMSKTSTLPIFRLNVEELS